MAQRSTNLTGDSQRPGPSSTQPEPICPDCGGAGFVWVDVPLQHPDFGKALPCHCRAEQIAAARLARLYGEAGLTGELQAMTFETFKMWPDLSERDRASLELALVEARVFARSPRGFLTFTGDVGTGKTHLAAAIANEVARQGQSVLFQVAPDLLDHLKATFREDSPVSFDERFDAVKGARLLVLDDFGTQADTAWAKEKLYQIVNDRYVAGLPTVITTNLSPSELDYYHRRIASRLASGVQVEIMAPDARRRKS